MDINFSNLALAEQVLQRQQGHATAIGRHLDSFGRLTNGDLGLILQLLQPLNEAIVDAGIQVSEYSGRVFELGTQKMASTQTAYLNAERQAYEASAQVSSMLGGSMPPFSPPTTPGLGAAADGAPSSYGVPQGSVFEQAYKDGQRLAEYTDETIDRAGNRITDALSGDRGVTEAVDAQSFLVTPVANEPWAEDIRWSFGVIFGAIDWLWEELAGYSLLEEMVKPFTGNWTRMNEASMAWKHVGDATTAISQNCSALLPPMASWTGKGSEAFLITAALVSKGHTIVAGPAGTISTALKLLAFVAKRAVNQIVKLLKFISEQLTKLAAKVSVPVLGWFAAAIDVGMSIHPLIQDVRKAYKTVNMIYDLVSGMTKNVSSSVDNVFQMADMYEAVARGAMARA